MEGNAHSGNQRPDNDSCDVHGSTHDAQVNGATLNWRLPLLGAAGFGLGFAIACAIDATIYDITKNFFADAFPGTRVGPEVGLLRGIIVGAVGGFILGLGSKDRTYFLWLSLAGAAGFGLAFALAITIGPRIGYLTGHELFAGAVVGGIGGFALGLPSPKGRFTASLLLCGAGAAWFACAFAFRSATWDGNLCSGWNALGGSLGGALLGLTLAAHSKTLERMP